MLKSRVFWCTEILGRDYLLSGLVDPLVLSAEEVGTKMMTQ